MKKESLLFTICIFAGMHLFAAPRYWVGALHSNWSNSNNWSATSGGPGGAGAPGDQDSVVINVDALINVDVSPTINFLRITSGSHVTLYTSVSIIFTVTNFLYIESPTTDVITTLKDSTSSDVSFNFVFKASTNAGATIFGNWVFEGGVPVSAGNGPTFTAASGSRVAVEAAYADGGIGGSLTYKQNTPDIVSSPSTLSFGHNASFILDNNPGGAIPDAYWKEAEFYPRYYNHLASNILITGNLSGELRHLSGRPSYGSLTADLSGLTADASLALPHGTLLKGHLNVSNTNNHTLTLLSGTGPSDSVTVTVGLLLGILSSGGILSVTGNNTRVALATATSASPATTYRLQLSGDFIQRGGNFSLQDYNDVTGSSTLAVKGNLTVDSNGTFFTNSTATGPGTRFTVEMDDPQRFINQTGTINTVRWIFVGSGTIDNGRNMVTLRINHSFYYQPDGRPRSYGVYLSGPLEVGRLDLSAGPLSTSSASILTVNDPDVTTGLRDGGGYVIGPLRRRTNSTHAYYFPTGRGDAPPAPTIKEPCEVIPASAEPSLYQAEYFDTRYEDTLHVKLPLTGVSKAGYWNISKISGADAKVQLTARPRQHPVGGSRGGTNRDVLVVARYADGQWVSEQGSILFPGDAISGSVVSRTLSEFGPFTFGYYPADSTQPVFVKCPSNIIINTDQHSCNALVEFKVESEENATIVYKVGSTAITSPYNFPRGITTVDVIASDVLRTTICSFTVTVNDVQAPVITGASANPSILSPADNELKNVSIDYTVTENCGPVYTSLSVSSNGSQNGNWEIIDQHNVRLRAEKTDEDRIYTITVTSTDDAGNQSVKTLTVSVPQETDKDKKIKLKVRVTPNPSRTYFNLYVTSNSDKMIVMRVFDQSGRIKEVRRFYPDANIRLGDDYRPGIYYAKFTQGNADKNVTLIKLRD